ncbi:hypothetical protein BCR42DRAFT_191256 [Absidia repens]|uniref:GDP-fucose protein O-fucosyltransferase-domain-containing protein n=1 Tax=Absidia repens TaxID=90262 RepID=A0A1X2IRZ9_9FUNG|nr:hypothetical protein BCR42DRAFT_191256 [Absidia repens]
MTRMTRLIYYLVALLFFFFLSLTTLSRYQLVEPVSKVNPEAIPVGTKYLTWLPHGEFTDQHEAFRNAIRLGLELDRTVIAPMLRLGKPLPWQPFDKLAQAYSTSQTKQLLRQKCTTSTTAIDDHDCITMNDWTEIPWSSFFDLKAISAEFGIPVIERLHGHGLGLEETAEDVREPITDVVVVDVLTFVENSTFIKQRQSQWHGFYSSDDNDSKGKWGGFLGRQVSQRIVNQPNQQQHQKQPTPLKTVIQAQQWDALAQRQYIQFGALSSTARYQVHSTIQQMDLRKALNRHLLVTPNQMAPLQQQADQVVTALGGEQHFSSLKLNFAKVIALDARMKHDMHGTTMETMDDLDAQMQKELMDAVVLEVFGDIPINQAVSAAMPVKSNSDLSLVLSQQQQQQQSSSSYINRQKLLDACIDYRQNIEEQYPIYYLVSDHIPSPSSRPDIYGPLLSFFPCLFTKSDMKQWGKLDMSTWISSHPYLQDRGVDYEKMLDPMLDILIAGRGYSFFEVPHSPLTRFMGWQGRASSNSSNSSSMTSL